MKFANIRLSWDVTIQVPIAELSKVLDILNKYPFIKDEYMDNDHYYVLTKKDVRVDLTDQEPEPFKRADQAQLKAA
jgi:hypothetical protein